MLLEEHIQHLREAEQMLPPDRQSGIDINAIKTEGEASDYIEKVTALLHVSAATGGAR